MISPPSATKGSVFYMALAAVQRSSYRVDGIERLSSRAF